MDKITRRTPKRTVLALAAVGLAAVAVAAPSALATARPVSDAPRVSGAGVGPATTLWAKVDQHGAILNASGFNSAQHSSRGNYTVLTDIDITNCALIGTVNVPTHNMSRTTIKVANTAGGVSVVTASSATNGYVDVPFSVAVFCS